MGLRVVGRLGLSVHDVNVTGFAFPRSSHRTSLRLRDCPDLQFFATGIISKIQDLTPLGVSRS